MPAQSITRWQLKEGFVFVDAFTIESQDGENPDRHPKDLPHAHIMNCTSYDYTMFNDYAAFILRFIIMGLDTETIIPQIIASEFPKTPDPKKDVADVVAMASSYLVVRNKKRKKHPLNSLGGGKKPGGYDLNFSVHSIGPGFLKGPF
jgi:hypothetical protein